MKFISSVHFNNRVEFDVGRESHLLKKVRTFKVPEKKYGGRNWARDAGKTYKYFEVLPKGLHIDFDDITIIVGDNGCGKTTLLKTLKFKNQDDSLTMAFVEDKEAYKREIFEKYVDNGIRKLEFCTLPKGVMVLDGLHKEIIQGELGNEVSKKAFDGSLERDQFASWFFGNSSSNGESLLDMYAGLDSLKDCVLVLDEPETSLSLKSIKMLRDKLKEINKTNQLIISTHNPYIMRLSDKVFDMEKKKYVDTEKYLKQYDM